MRQYIKKLQSKEDHVRKQILIASLIVSMSFVSFIWMYSLGTRFNTEVADQTSQDVKPFKLFGESIANTFKNIGASVGNISSLKEESSEAIEKEVRLIPIERTVNQ